MKTEAEDKSVRDRILEAADALLRSGGPAALTTRAVATAAGVQAPTLYRLFEDKQGLLDATADYGLARYVAEKSSRRLSADPLENFRRAFDLHIAFGVDNPALFAILTTPRAAPSPAAEAGFNMLRHFVRALAAAGRLKVEQARATALVHAVGTGTILSLLNTPPQARDAGLATAAREALIAAITATGAAPGAGPAVAAITLRANLDALDALTPGERHLMAELLDRVTARPAPSSAPERTEQPAARPTIAPN